MLYHVTWASLPEILEPGPLSGGINLLAPDLTRRITFCNVCYTCFGALKIA